MYQQRTAVGQACIKRNRLQHSITITNISSSIENNVCSRLYNLHVLTFTCLSAILYMFDYTFLILSRSVTGMLRELASIWRPYRKLPFTFSEFLNYYECSYFSLYDCRICWAKFSQDFFKTTKRVQSPKLRTLLASVCCKIVPRFSTIHNFNYSISLGQFQRKIALCPILQNHTILNSRSIACSISLLALSAIRPD